MYYPLGTGESMSESEYEYMYALCNDPSEFGEPTAPSLDSVPAGKWRVRGGAVLEISRMAVEHLRNAIALFTCAGHGDHTKIRELREELARR